MPARPSKRRRLSPSEINGDKNTAKEDHSLTTDTPHTTPAGKGSPPQTEKNHEEVQLEETDQEDTEEDDEFEGFEEESDTVSAQQSVAAPTKQSPSARPNRMQVTDTSKGSVIRMQVDEMLRQVRPTYGKKEAPAEDMLRRIKAVIETLPDTEALSIQEAEKKLLKSHKVVIPFPSPRPLLTAQYKLAYSKPESINVIGSYVLMTGTRVDGRLSMDLVVNMPPSLFSPKDYLDYRYFHKRAYYIACIAAGIQASADLDVKMSFSCFHGNSLLPVIRIQPLDKDTDSAFARSLCDIYIIPAIVQDFFPFHKTMPSRCCIRLNGTQKEEDSTEAPPTPFYNASVRADSSITSFLKLLHSTASHCAGFREACLLGRIWLRQRGFGNSLQKGGFGHFEWAALVALLLQGGGPQGKPVLLSSYDGYQLFRATVQFLALRNMAKQPLIVKGGNDRSDALNEPIEIDAVHLGTGGNLPMCFDQVRGMNILYKMMPWSYTSLRREAQASVKLLTSFSDPFESLFIYKIDLPLVQYDLTARISFGINAGQILNTLEISGRLKKLYDNIERALGDRARSINIALPADCPWPVNIARTRQRDGHALIGVVLNLDNASRTVDRGPSAEDAVAAASFRDFWGDKSELRRFKDGQILECVAWIGNGPLSITKEIIQYVVQKHVAAEVKSPVTFIGNDFSSTPVADPDLEASATVSEQLVVSFRALEDQIRSIEGLPLQIRQIQAARPGFGIRAASLSKYQGGIPTDVVIQFEGSGRWPDDLAAIAMTKIAFLLRLDELITEKGAKITTKLGLENEHNEILNRSFLDVNYSGGSAFRLRIHHEREQTLIERRLGDKSINPKEREEAAVALAKYKRDFTQKPRHTQAMQTLVTKFRAITSTLQAVKAWFNSHLLGNHFTEELIEIIVARIFLQPYPWPVPSSTMTGLLRTLHFLAEWDWQNAPLIVDFSGGMKKDDTLAIQTRFEAWRKIDPSLNRVVMFVATNYDEDGTTWTEYHPAKVVAGRMTNLAKAACKAVMDKGLELDLGALFKSPLKAFDFVIRIHPRFTNSDPSSNVQSKYKNLQVSTADTDLVGYNPVKLFVEEVQSLYGDCFVLFCDWTSQEVIAGLWSPHTADRKWKVNLPYSTLPVQGSGMAVEVGAAINKAAILQELARLGGDMVAKVESNK